MLIYQFIGHLIQFCWLIRTRLLEVAGTIYTKSVLSAKHIQFGSGLKANGFPRLTLASNSSMKIGKNFRMNSGYSFNMIGRNQPCTIQLTKNAVLTIGDNVGISSTSIFSSLGVFIEDNVKLGGGVVIYDTDFHSLNLDLRSNENGDFAESKKSEVLIGANAFVGAHSIILKGSKIGENSIIGAGSVVAGEVPANQIWAGNPAKFISHVG